MYDANCSRGPMIREIEESERPRERLLSLGSTALSNAELVAILIGTGVRDESAVTLASKVLGLSGGLAGLPALQPAELCALKGIGDAKACTLAAAFELGRRMASEKAGRQFRLSDPDSAAALFMEELRYLKKECFCVAMLNVKNQLIGKETVSVGGLSSSSAHPREVFSGAIKKGANAVILAHNHPSGDPAPSKDDTELTKRLADCGRLLGIQVLDHIIIGGGVYVSLRQMGMIQ